MTEQLLTARGLHTEQLRKLTILYFSLPQILFATFLKAPLMVAALGIMAAGLLLAFRTPRSALSPPAAEDEERLSAWLLAACVLLAVAWCGVLGVAGFGIQDSDWLKHNSLLRDLTECQWPPRYVDQAGDVVGLSYYIAYYLPAALLGKITGSWAIANVALFAWTALGTSLVMAWFVRFCKARTPLPAVFLILFSGLGILATPLTSGSVFPPTQAVEAWVPPFLSVSHTLGMRLHPHNQLGAWLGASLILYEQDRGTLRNATFYLALALLWAVFSAVGLVPFVILGCFRGQLKSALSPQNLIIAPCILAVTGIFYAGHSAQVPVGFIWDYFEARAWVPRLALWYVLNFGAYAVLFPGNPTKTPVPVAVRRFYLLSLALAPLFQLVVLGRYYDLGIKALAPAMFYVAVMYSFFLTHGFDYKRTRDRLWCGALVMGAVSSITLLATSIEKWRLQIPSDKVVAHIADPITAYGYGLPDSLLAQYVVPEGSPFYSRVSRASRPVRVNRVLKRVWTFEDPSSRNPAFVDGFRQYIDGPLVVQGDLAVGGGKAVVQRAVRPTPESSVELLHNVSSELDYGFGIRVNGETRIAVPPGGKCYLRSSGVVVGDSEEDAAAGRSGRLVVKNDGALGLPGVVTLTSPEGKEWNLYVDDAGDIHIEPAMPAPFQAPAAKE